MPAQPIEAPPRILETHVLDRPLGAAAGAGTGWRNVDWPIQRAFEARRLAGIERWDAVLRLSRCLAAAEIRSGRDSTQMDIVTGGGGDPFTQARADAVCVLGRVRARMSKADYILCETVCEGFGLGAAVFTACGPGYSRAVYKRVGEALDALVLAFRGESSKA